MSLEKILREIALERFRQDEKWGEQNHNTDKWLVIIAEELGEASEASLDAFPHSEAITGTERREHLLRYRKELLQIAASAVVAIESLERVYGIKDV